MTNPHSKSDEGKQVGKGKPSSRIKDFSNQSALNQMPNKVRTFTQAELSQIKEEVWKDSGIAKFLLKSSEYKGLWNKMADDLIQKTKEYYEQKEKEFLDKIKEFGKEPRKYNDLIKRWQIIKIFNEVFGR